MSNIITTAIEVIDLQKKGLVKLKNSINPSFEKAVKLLAKCKSKIILIGVGKSGLIAAKIAATLSSVGTPSFSISANDCSHGDLGSITNKDILILISNSGNSIELKNIIEYANRYKIKTISIVSKKNSMLYKSTNLKILIPEVKEAGFNIVPTTSTSLQLSIGDALAISVMKYKKFSKFDFKKFHPAGSLGLKLKTVEDLMVKKINIPFINENKTLKEGLAIINKKNLGILLAIDKNNNTTGILTDGDIKRIIEKGFNINTKKIKFCITKNSVKIEKDVLAIDALKIMNEKKITCLPVYKKGEKRKSIGVIHIHSILSSNIS